MRENQHPGLADGFVMGEGGVVFLLKRLEDAERDGDRIYAVVRGLAGASDGKGKGITAPNPVGQRLAVERAWRQAGLSPATVGLIEGHGTSTRVGDVVEVESLMAAFAGAGLAPGSVPLGSVKSNIGHLKSAAGGAGMLKAVLALRDKVLPPSLHFDRPNPAIDFEHAPFHVNTELAEWKVPAGGVRRVGVSAFGFGGTNFHAVLDEYVPGAHGGGPRLHAGVELPRPVQAPVAAAPVTGTPAPKAPPRGALVLGAASAEALAGRLATLRADAEAGRGRSWPARHAPGRAGRRRRSRRGLEAAARHGRVPWHGPRPQGGLPLHRPGLPVRQHAGRAARDRAGGGRDLRRGGPRHGPAARPAAERDRLRRPERPRRARARRGGPQADGGHPAGGAHRGHRAHPPAGQLWHPAGHGHGPQPRRPRRRAAPVHQPPEGG